MSHTEYEPRIIIETGLDLRVAEIIEPVIASMDYRLVRVRLMNQNGLTLQVMAERNDGTMTVEDCEAISTAISPVLDVEDPISNEYTLEVSSPGMDRPLFTLEQFAAHAGEQVKIKLRVPFEGRRNFQGVLRGVEEQDVVVLVDDHEFLLPIDSIDKANIVPRFD